MPKPTYQHRMNAFSGPEFYRNAMAVARQRWSPRAIYWFIHADGSPPSLEAWTNESITMLPTKTNARQRVAEFASMDVVILSRARSDGWWGAWMCHMRGGTVLYDAMTIVHTWAFAVGSVVPEDYYPPFWIKVDAGVPHLNPESWTSWVQLSAPLSGSRSNASIELCVRTRDSHSYILDWATHYLANGVTRIHFLDDESQEPLDGVLRPLLDGGWATLRRAGFRHKRTFEPVFCHCERVCALKKKWNHSIFHSCSWLNWVFL